MVRNTLFVSSAALHLFLQTELNRKDMDSLIQEAKRRGSMNSVVRAISTYGSRFNKNSNLQSMKSFNRSSGGTSFSNDLTASHSVSHLDTYLPSSSCFPYTPPQRSETSPNLKNNLTLGGANSLNKSVMTKGALSYEEEDYGDWVVINDSPTLPDNSPSLNSSHYHPPSTNHRQISSEHYTKVSWKIGDFRNSSEYLNSKPTPHSHHIPVPSNLKSKSYLFGPLIAQSAGTRGHSSAVGSPCSLAGVLKQSDLRRAVSDSNVSQQYLESNPPSFSLKSSSVVDHHAVSQEVLSNDEQANNLDHAHKSEQTSTSNLAEESLSDLNKEVTVSITFESDNVDSKVKINEESTINEKHIPVNCENRATDQSLNNEQSSSSLQNNDVINDVSVKKEEKLMKSEISLEQELVEDDEPTDSNDVSNNVNNDVHHCD